MFYGLCMKINNCESVRIVMGLLYGCMAVGNPHVFEIYLYIFYKIFMFNKKNIYTLH